MNDVDEDDSTKPTGDGYLGDVTEAEDVERRRARYEELAGRDDYHLKLQRLGSHYLDVDDAFAPLSLVQWKPGMRNTLFPLYGRPMIVMGQATDAMLPLQSVLPVSPEDIMATLLVGFIDGDNDFVIIRVDPHRVMRWSSPASDE